jgi:tyrosyl-DNA phosphodiesterase 2
LWHRTGSRKECEYTWDMTRNTNLEVFIPTHLYQVVKRLTFQFPGQFKPRCRFDRLYIRDATPLQCVPEFFGLLGIERVPKTQLFPSDHWGLYVTFKIKSN